MTDKYIPNFPRESLWAIDILVRQIQQDPNFLEDTDFSAEERDVLTRLAGSVAEEKIQIDPTEDKWTRLERESQRLFEELSAAGETLEIKDHSEKMAYFRTATSLLDKIVAIQERTANLKKISQFHSVVLRIMDDVLTDDQRTQVMQELEEAVKS